MAPEPADTHAQIVRSMLDHESDVINHRLTWMATFQGLLFAALGFAWDKGSTHALVEVFCWLGITISFLTEIALFKASLATRTLLDWWEEPSKTYDGPPVIGHAFGNQRLFRRFRCLFPPWNFIPVCFILAWLAVLCVDRYYVCPVSLPPRFLVRF